MENWEKKDRTFAEAYKLLINQSLETIDGNFDNLPTTHPAKRPYQKYGSNYNRKINNQKKVVKNPVWMTNLRKRACSYCNELAAVYGDGYSPAVSNCRLLLDIIHFLREGTPIL